MKNIRYYLMLSAVSLGIYLGTFNYLDRKLNYDTIGNRRIIKCDKGLGEAVAGLGAFVLGGSVFAVGLLKKLFEENDS